MMGHSHAWTGAAAWLASAGALAWTAHPMPLPVLATGAAMCAAGALLPDLDLSGKVTTCEGGATVAHTFGAVSMFVAECVDKASLAIYNATRGKRDERKTGGHRTATHSLIFNLGVGLGVYELCVHHGRRAVVPVLFLAFAMALRGLFPKWSKRAGWPLTTATAAGAALGSYFWLPVQGSYQMLGAALGFGGLIHLLGDCCTEKGCPLLAPIPTGRGKRWRRVGVPKSLAMTTGGIGERVTAALSGVAVALSLALLAALAIGVWSPIDQPTPAPAVAHVKEGHR